MEQGPGPQLRAAHHLADLAVGHLIVAAHGQDRPLPGLQLGDRPDHDLLQLFHHKFSQHVLIFGGKPVLLDLGQQLLPALPPPSVVCPNLVQRDGVQPAPESLWVLESVKNLEHFGDTLLHDVRRQIAIQSQASDVLGQPGLDDPDQVAFRPWMALLCLPHQLDVVSGFAHVSRR